MTKAQKKAYLEQQAAEKKRLQEEEALAEAANRKTAYKMMLIELKKQDEGEQGVRDVVLKNIVDQFQYSTNLKMELQKEILENEEWTVYMRTDGSPDPRQPPQLTCALYRWKMQEAEDNSFLLAQKRDIEIQPLMEVLNDIIQYPHEYTERQLEIFKEVRLELWDEWTRTLEVGTRRWATLPGPRAPPRPERHSHRVRQHSLALWLSPPGPPKMPKTHEPPTEAIEIPFPDLGLTLTLPSMHIWKGVVVRTLWLDDDLLSPANPFFKDPDRIPCTRGCDLYSYTKQQYDEMILLRTQQAKARADFYDGVRARLDYLYKLLDHDKFGTLKAEKVELAELKLAEPESVPLPRDILIQQEADEYTASLEALRVEVEEAEVNLRKYRMCGGLLYLQLMGQPPRPKTMAGDITLTMMEAQDKLSAVEFREDYNPPPPPTAGAVRAPEEIEADIRRQEAALEKLLLVNIQLPETVLWLEPPLVCCWQEDRVTWTTSDIHDLKYNEDKFTVNFRVGILKPIGFATPKYSNLPFQGWELRPNPDRISILVTIMGAIIVLELNVSEAGIRVKSIQNGGTSALQDMVGNLFTLRELIGRMQAGGVDFFPTEDAPLLMEGSCPKQPIMEEHLYKCMAHCCTAYNFQWSRWNVSAGREAIVQQFREFLIADIETFEILHVTPLKAALVVATEVSSEYSTESVAGLAFYPDLYSLVADNGSEDAKEILSKIPWKLVENVKDLLWAVKPCSFS